MQTILYHSPFQRRRHADALVSHLVVQACSSLRPIHWLSGRETESLGRVAGIPRKPAWGESGNPLAYFILRYHSSQDKRIQKHPSASEAMADDASQTSAIEAWANGIQSAYFGAMYVLQQEVGTVMHGYYVLTIINYAQILSFV